MKDYLQTVVSKGKTYNYFRPSNRLRRNQFPRMRLSDDPVLAATEAATLARLRPATAEPLIYDHLAILMKEGRKRAAKRGIEFRITEPQLQVIIRAQDNRCAVSGLPFDFEDRGDSGEAFRRPFAPSLDRIDHRLGYVAPNVRIVCCAVNIALNEWGLQTLLKVARAIVKENETATPMENGKEIASSEDDFLDAETGPNPL